MSVSTTVFGASNAENGECFERELDPQTNRIYQNKAQWEADHKALLAKTPKAPVFYRLKWGYDVAMKESRNSRGIGSDKRKHCYVGCRIANDVGHDVAVYAGYYKEEKDILDCDPKTHFDLADITATIFGADLALKKNGAADKNYCRSECRRSIRK